MQEILTKVLITQTVFVSWSSEEENATLKRLPSLECLMQ
jgi:hypothetical protein